MYYTQFLSVFFDVEMLNRTLNSYNSILKFVPHVNLILVRTKNSTNFRQSSKDNPTQALQPLLFFK